MLKKQAYFKIKESFFAKKTNLTMASGSPDLSEMVGCCHDLFLGFFHLLLAAGHDEDWVFAAHGRFDVGVRLGAQCLDFAS